jgi:hypothetical protein
MCLSQSLSSFECQCIILSGMHPCQTLQQRLDSIGHEEIALTHLLQEKREEVTSLENCLTYLFNECNILQDEVSEGQSQISILNDQTTLISH